MIHCDVNELRDILWRRTLANEQPNLLESIGHPGGGDAEGDANSADRIQVPSIIRTDHRHDQPKRVDKNAVAVVNLCKLAQPR